MNHLSHAPGPWRVSLERNRVYIRSDMDDPRSAKESLVVCQVPVRTKGCNNLNVLLHAPELVAALEKIAMEANRSGFQWIEKDSKFFQLSEAINEAIDVLCKAKGV
jgi:hypothetical protein